MDVTWDGIVNQPRANLRAGFTLIELLMVLILVGILASLLLFAVGRGMLTGKNAATLSEIDQLSTAIEGYRTERGSYPPTTGLMIQDVQNSTSVNYSRIGRHIAKAWPRYVGTYPTTGTIGFREDVALATESVVNYIVSNGGTVNGTYIPSAYGSSKAGLDVNNLDPAEALVFWLGGLPDPTQETKLAGFSMDPANPFVSAVARTTGKDPSNTAIELVVPSAQSNGQRTTRMFQFDPRRLVDYDGDGWMEYMPPNGTTAQNTPPYVYFDYGSYTLGPIYPSPVPTSTNSAAAYQGGSHSSVWGNIFPYAADPVVTGSVKFVNSQKYQIIAAGVDNRFDDAFSYSTVVTTGPWWFAPAEYFPSGTNYGDADKDNLTNFASGPLSDSIPK